MKVYGVFYYDSDDCTYSCNTLISICSDEYKALEAMDLAVVSGDYYKENLYIEEITVDSLDRRRRVYP